MHALILPEGTTYTIYFGGSYEEHWAEDSSLFISYRDRRAVTARLTGESWLPMGGDAQLCAAIVSSPRDAVIRRYFTSAVTTYAASQECLRRHLPLTRIYEYFSFDDPIAAAELLRLLMDDCGFRIEAAFPAVVRSCASILLTEEEQRLVWDIISRQDLKVKPRMAADLRSHSGNLTAESIAEIIDAVTVRQHSVNAGVSLKLPNTICEKYFAGMNTEQMAAVVEQALAAWYEEKAAC